MTRSIRLTLLALAIGLALAGCSREVSAPGAGSSFTMPKPPADLPKGDTAAWVNDVPVPKTYIDEMLNSVPQEMRGAYAQGEKRRQLIEQLVGVELVCQQAEKEGYLARPEVQNRINIAARQVVFSEYMREHIKDIRPPDENDARKFFDSMPELAGQDYTLVRGRIMGFLAQKAQQERMEQVVDDLRGKSSVKLNESVVGSSEPPAAAPFGGMNMPGGPPPGAMPPGAMPPQGGPPPGAMPPQGGPPPSPPAGQ